MRSENARFGRTVGRATVPNKSLGQHWLKDRDILEDIAADADITDTDTVLEIGPGLGTLTSVLLSQAKAVTAVEFDRELAKKLPKQFPGKNLTVINDDILQFDTSTLPKGYKAVANVPYYITSKIIQHLLTSENKPSVAVLLVQKEVAERLAAQPGDMSLLALSAQVYAEVSLGDVVPAEYFTPPPKVDSQTVILRVRPRPLVSEADQLRFFRVARAGFSAKRKKLRSSLAGGLAMEKAEVETLLKKANIDPNARAEMLSVEDWQRIVREIA